MSQRDVVINASKTNDGKENHLYSFIRLAPVFGVESSEMVDFWTVRCFAFLRTGCGVTNASYWNFAFVRTTYA